MKSCSTAASWKTRDLCRPYDADTKWENLVNLYKRFESDEVPGARLRVVWRLEQDVTIGWRRIFQFRAELNNHLDARLWQDADLELLDPLTQQWTERARSQGR